MADFRKHSFIQELTKLINSLSLENSSNTPDWILAEYLFNCLMAYNEAVHERDKWNEKFPKRVEKLND